jgi:hypothetical protein
MKKCHFFMFHMTRATTPGHRRRGESSNEARSAGALAGIRGASGGVL